MAESKDTDKVTRQDLMAVGVSASTPATAPFRNISRQPFACYNSGDHAAGEKWTCHAFDDDNDAVNYLDMYFENKSTRLLSMCRYVPRGMTPNLLARELGVAREDVNVRWKGREAPPSFK